MDPGSKRTLFSWVCIASRALIRVTGPVQWTRPGGRGLAGDENPLTLRSPPQGPAHLSVCSPPLRSHLLFLPSLLHHPNAQRVGQVSKDGDIRLVSGMGAKGTSRLTLSGGKGLGPIGAKRLADLLREAPAPLLVELDLRHTHPNPPSLPVTLQAARSSRKLHEPPTLIRSKS
jgi:hypothetical protein